MAGDKVTPEELLDMFRDVADRIERGDVKAFTLKYMTNEGEQEHTFKLDTAEEQLAALLAIRKILGQVH